MQRRNPKFGTSKLVRRKFGNVHTQESIFLRYRQKKVSVARVRLFPNGTGKITINQRDIDEYFGLETLKLIVRQPLEATATTGKFDVECTVSGGGFTGQAGAIRHGLSRALLQANETEYRPILKAAGYLTPRSAHEGKKEVRSEGSPPRSPVQQALIEFRYNLQNHRSLTISVVFSE